MVGTNETMGFWSLGFDGLPWFVPVVARTNAGRAWYSEYGSSGRHCYIC